MSVFTRRLTPVYIYVCVLQDWEHRHEEDKLMLERLLVLVRNVLHIPPDPATEQVGTLTATLRLLCSLVHSVSQQAMYISASSRIFVVDWAYRAGYPCTFSFVCVCMCVSFVL